MELKNKSKFKETEIGLIPEDWGVDSIGNVSLTITDYVANGSFASLKDNVKYSDTKEYAIMIRFIDFNREFSGNFVYVNKKGYDFLKKTKLFGGEIIISNVGAYAGTVFKVPFIRSPMTLGPNSIMLKTRHNDDFYYYWLKSIYGRDSLQDIKSGSAVPKFNKTDFKKIFVPVPPIKEQEKIAEILLSLDNEIELNRKINSNLEKIASLLFKHYFIDIGDTLPHGWSVGRIGDFAKVKSGFAFKGEDFKNVGVPVIKIKNVLDPEISFKNIDYISERIVEEKAQDFILKPKDILIAMSGNTTGKIGIMPKTKNYYVLNQRVGKYFLKNEKNLGYLYFYLRSGDVQKNIIQSAYGSAQPNISPSILEDMKILIPSKEVLDNFNSLSNKIIDIISSNSFENNNLSELRDFLLPRLMSGRIRVKYERY